MNFPEHVKNKLLSLIQEMATVPWFFSKNPNVDFSRNRKLDFASIIKFILSMESGSIKKELLEYFHFSTDTPSASAFCQQRAKLSPETFWFLFHQFNTFFPFKNNYKGYRLLACDGSDLGIFHNPNPKDADTYYKARTAEKGYNQLHLNVLYDLCEKRYTDILIQPMRKRNESQALTQMVDIYQGQKKTIFIADRGYETYNIFAHIQEKEMFYLIRVKDGTGGSMTESFKLPDKEEFDHHMHLILTRKYTKEVMAHPELYKRLANRSSAFDYAELALDFRVVRFAITEDSYECIITRNSCRYI